MPMQQLTFVPAAGKSIMCKGDSVDMTQQEANEDHNHILDTLNHPWSVVPPEIRSLSIISKSLAHGGKEGKWKMKKKGRKENRKQMFLCF